MASSKSPDIAEIDEAQSDGHRRLRVRRIRRARSGGARHAVRAHGLREGRQAPLQGCLALPPGRRELHRQCREGQLRPGLRPRARAQHLRHRAQGQELGGGLQARSVARRLGRRGQGRADGAQHPGHQGHRRFADLPGRPLRRSRHHLRCRLRVPARRRAQSQGRRPHLHRPPDAQRPSRAHGGVGRFLRAALQFPRGPLLRHRGQAHRAQEQGDDQPVRQDPHPDQREHRRQVADPGIPLGLSRRGHPAHRARHRRHLRDGRDARRPRACRSRPCPTPITSRSTRACRATART